MKTWLRQLLCWHQYTYRHVLHPLRTEFKCKKCGKETTWL